MKSRRWAASLVVLAMLPLAGCDVRGTAEQLDGGKFRVDATLWNSYDLSYVDEKGQTQHYEPEPCFGLAATEQLAVETLSDPADPHRFGCRLLGVVRPQDLSGPFDQSFITVGTDRSVLLVPSSFMEALRTTNRQADDGRPVAGQVFDLAVTFQGPVLNADPSAKVEGNTVHWTDNSADGLRAVALREGVLSPMTWRIISAAGGGVLGAVLAALALLMIGRRRRPSVVADSAPEEDESADAHATRADGVPEPTDTPPPEADRDDSVWASE